MKQFASVLGLVLSLIVLLMLYNPSKARADGPVPNFDDITILPSTLDYPGQPFEVEIRASNIGSDAEGGGSITLSLPEGQAIAILEADVPVLLDWQPANLAGIPKRVGTNEYLAIARRIAQESITLVRDESGLLPLARDQSVLVIWPQGAGNLAGALQTYSNEVQILQLSLNPSPDEISLAIQSAATASVIVVGTVNARVYPGQVQLLQALKDHPLIVAALGVPYDLMSFPDMTTYLATYGDVPVSLEALAQILFGQIKPKGRLPVDLPGLYPRGHGMTDFVP